MSTRPNLPVSNVFNPSLFSYESDYLTLQDADLRYVRIGGDINANSISCNSLYLGGSLVDVSSISGVTNGIASANKALITNASNNIYGINTLNATTLGCTTLSATNVIGTLSTAAQPNVTSLGTLSYLTVSSGTSNSFMVKTDDNSIKMIGRVDTGSNYAAIGTQTATKLVWLTGYTPRAVVSSNGLKIGNTFDEPRYAIDASGDVASTGSYRAGSDGSTIIINNLGQLQYAAQPNITSLGTLTGLNLNGTQSTTNNYSIWTGTSAAPTNTVGVGIRFNSMVDSGTGYLRSYNYVLSQDMNLSINNSNIYVKENRNVGIDVSNTPAYKLDVGGDISLTGSLRNASTVFMNSSGVLQVAGQTGITQVGDLTTIRSYIADQNPNTTSLADKYNCVIQCNTSTTGRSANIALVADTPKYDTCTPSAVIKAVRLSGGYGSGQLQFATKSSASQTGSCTDRVFINSTGMGILTGTGPSYALDVNGDVNFSGSLRNGSTIYMNSSGVLQQGAQTNITSVGTLTNALTVQRSVSGNYGLVVNKTDGTYGMFVNDLGLGRYDTNTIQLFSNNVPFGSLNGSTGSYLWNSSSSNCLSVSGLAMAQASILTDSISKWAMQIRCASTATDAQNGIAFLQDTSADASPSATISCKRWAGTYGNYGMSNLQVHMKSVATQYASLSKVIDINYKCMGLFTDATDGYILSIDTTGSIGGGINLSGTHKLISFDGNTLIDNDRNANFAGIGGHAPANSSLGYPYMLMQQKLTANSDIISLCFGCSAGSSNEYATLRFYMNGAYATHDPYNYLSLGVNEARSFKVYPVGAASITCTDNNYSTLTLINNHVNGDSIVKFQNQAGNQFNIGITQDPTYNSTAFMQQGSHIFMRADTSGNVGIGQDIPAISGMSDVLLYCGASNTITMYYDSSNKCTFSFDTSQSSSLLQMNAALRITGGFSYSYTSTRYYYDYSANNWGSVSSGSLQIGLYMDNSIITNNRTWSYSDRRLKENIEYLDVDLDRYMQWMIPRTYLRKDTQYQEIGVVAQEIGHLDNLLINVVPDDSMHVEQEGDIEGHKLCVNYDRLSVVNASVIRKLIDKNHELESEILNIKDVLQEQAEVIRCLIEKLNLFTVL